MRIAILTNEYPPYIYGGAGVHVDYLTRELAALDDGAHHVQVLCFGDQAEARDNVQVEGVLPSATIPAADARHEKLFATLLQDLIMSGRLDRPDIVHCHTWYTHLAGCIARQLHEVPLVLTTHSLEPHRPWKAEQLGSAYNVSSWVERTAFQNADGVIAVSESMREDVQSLYGVPDERVDVIHNGIDLDEYRPVSGSATLREHGIDGSKPYVLFVGRITRQKGIVHLVRSIPHLRPGTQVVLCAGAPDTAGIAAEMEAAVEEVRGGGTHPVVWIRDMLPRPEIIELYTHAAVFVCPSVYEPFGIINLEAMACGTAVVASAVGGIPEVVVHGETGLLVPVDSGDGASVEPRDPARFARDLADAVNALLDDDTLRATMARKGRERVERQFSWDSIARRTAAFYEKLIPADPSRS